MTDLIEFGMSPQPAHPRKGQVRARSMNTPDEIHFGIKSVYPSVLDVRVPKNYRPTRNCAQAMCLGKTLIRRLSAGGYGWEVETGESILIGFSTEGGAQFAVGPHDVVVEPFKTAHVFPAGQRVRAEIAPNSRLFTLEVLPSDLIAQAQSLYGHQQYRGAQSAEVDLRNDAGATYVRNMIHIFREIETLQSWGLDLAGIVSLEEHLLNLAVAASRPDLVERANAGADVGSALSLRAKDYLAAHAAEPVRIADVAMAMGVSIRALQMAFKRHFDCSPLDFLIQCRLELARARLQAAQPKESVSSIARQCGFIGMGAFAKRYCAAYGDRPSHTLRRALMGH